MGYAKPIPVVIDENRPFWEATKRGQLLLQHCRNCSAYRYPASLLCPECSSTAFDWKPVSGRGKVYSFVIFHRAYHPAFAGDLPYVVACIELQEGPRLMSNVIGIPPEQVRCDMPVEVAFEEISKEISLPKFRPVTVRS
ncbi:MAG: OB-fold domain-containing protein [Xanthobacteraceae bacterium]